MFRARPDEPRRPVKAAPFRPAHNPPDIRSPNATAKRPPAGGYRNRRRIISRAALKPGAPVTPPPGWVEAPHMYKPGIGER